MIPSMAPFNGSSGLFGSPKIRPNTFAPSRATEAFRFPTAPSKVLPIFFDRPPSLPQVASTACPISFIPTLPLAMAAFSFLSSPLKIVSRSAERRSTPFSASCINSSPMSFPLDRICEKMMSICPKPACPPDDAAASAMFWTYWFSSLPGLMPADSARGTACNASSNAIGVPRTTS